MVRVMLAAILLVGLGFPLVAFQDTLGPWGQFIAGLAIMLVVSAVLPHYFYRGEPLLPDRRRRH
jgi:hypothetical protein